MVEEEDIATRNSTFQQLNYVQKNALHQHHLSRKICRLRMRQDIINEFWTVYEQEAWKRLIEVVGTPGVTEKDAETFAHETILSVNKNDIVKLWREKLMMLIPIVEQYEMRRKHRRNEQKVN